MQFVCKKVLYKYVLLARKMHYIGLHSVMLQGTLCRMVFATSHDFCVSFVLSVMDGNVARKGLIETILENRVIRDLPKGRINNYAVRRSVLVRFVNLEVRSSWPGI